MILNLTAAEVRALATGSVPQGVRRKAAALATAKPPDPIPGQMDVDDVLAEMHAPTMEESRAAYERR